MINKQFIKQHQNKGFMIVSIVIMTFLFLSSFQINNYLKVLCCCGEIVVFFLILAAIKFNHIRKGQSIADKIHSQHEAIVTRQVEAALLKEKMDEAIKTLKTSSCMMQYRGKAALYALPWFIIMGPSAVGKSTLLRNSGLNFPLEQDGEIRIKGFGGTRNCDWWFSDEAILLDTAGRYTTEVDDHDEWITFLKILKKYRRRQPINGVIVALTTDELMRYDELKLQAHVNIIRKRLDEIADVLGFVCPVDLVLTKCDLIPGFLDFFADLSPKEREDFIGIREISTNAVCELMEQFFNQRIPNMTAKRDLNTKIQIFHFPYELQGIFEKIKKMSELFNKGNNDHPVPWLRGLYLTSSEQQNEQNSSKGYFIKGFFKTLFLTKQTSRSSHQTQVHQWILKILSGIFIFLIIGIFWIGLSHAFIRNSDLLKRNKTYSYEVTKLIQGGGVHIQKQMDDLMPLATEYFINQYEKGDLNLFLRMGLFRGNAINQATGLVVARVLQDRFIPCLVNQIKSDLIDDSKRWKKMNTQQKEHYYFQYYSTLKAYLLLCYPDYIHPQKDAFLYLKFSHGDRFDDADYILKLMTIYLSVLKENPEYRLSIHPVLIDQTIVRKARQQLNMHVSPQIVLDRIDFNQFNHATITLDDLYPNQELCLSRARLLQMYTLKSWTYIVKKAIDHELNNLKRQDWVLNHAVGFKMTSMAKKQLRDKIYQQYFTNYRQAWIRFINGLSLRPFQSIDNTNLQLKLLTQRNNSFEKLISIISKNLSVLPANVFQFSKIEKIKYDQVIKKVRDEFQIVSFNSNDHESFVQYGKKVLVQDKVELVDSVNVIKTLTDHIQHEDVRNAMIHLLESPFREVWRVVLSQAVNTMQQKWQSTLFPQYKQMIANKFPFFQSDHVVSYVDLVKFFNPTQGCLWRFVQQEIDPYITVKKGQWGATQWLGVAPNFSKNFLLQLNRAQAITDAFFENQTNSPSFQFELFPIPHPKLSQIQLGVNKRVMRYQNGPVHWYSFSWDGRQSNQEARLILHAKNDRIVSSHQYRGLWSLFKLINGAHFVRLKNNQIRLEWPARYSSRYTIHVQMLLRTAGTNVFANILRKHFSLPTTIESR